MPKQLFQCEKCGSIHESEKDAVLCEGKHLPSTKYEFVYSNKDTKSKYPKEVKLWFESQCVTYHREGN
jgi:hypothetical protein